MDSFALVAQLDEDALRGLLRTGEPRERVWAAWALGLRLGQGAVPELARMTRAEPEPGVRRHLLVVLAGAHELDLLAVLARDDPDGYVRAAACQYLGGVAPGNEAVSGLLRERFEQDASADVRLAVLRVLGAMRPFEMDVIRRAAADPNSEVREGALEVLSAAREALDSMGPEWLAQESDELWQRLLQAWLEGRGAEALLRLAAELPAAIEVEVLRFLYLHGKVFPWPLFSKFAARRDPSIDLLLLPLLRRYPTPVEARPWLLAVAARARPLEISRSADPETWAPLGPLWAVLETEDAQPLAGIEREDALRVEHRLERDIASGLLTEAPESEDLISGDEHRILQLLREALARK